MSVESGHSLVIGRHTDCGLRLPCDTISLRHLVAHARSDPPDTAPVRERLAQGVLLGRYDRCGIRLSGLGSISRVHLLLVRLGEDVLAIDTSSTNGTWRGRTEIETTTLGDPDSLELGSVLRLHWRRLPSGATGNQS